LLFLLKSRLHCFELKVRPSGNGGVTISPAPSAGDMRDVI